MPVFPRGPRCKEAPISFAWWFNRTKRQTTAAGTFGRTGAGQIAHAGAIVAVPAGRSKLPSATKQWLGPVGAEMSAPLAPSKIAHNQSHSMLPRSSPTMTTSGVEISATTTTALASQNNLSANHMDNACPPQRLLALAKSADPTQTFRLQFTRPTPVLAPKGGDTAPLYLLAWPLTVKPTTAAVTPDWPRT